MWISDKNKTVYYVGRFKEIEGGFCCSLSGSSVIAGFEGNGISVRLKSTAEDDAVNVSGDSITAGYGNEGSIDKPGFRHAEENAAKTYGALAAKQLGAEAVIIGWSGMGVYRDLGGGSKHLMPELYLRTLSEENEKWNFNEYIPRAVVVNLGTNDFAGTKDLNTSEFVDTYISFIREIRAL